MINVSQIRVEMEEVAVQLIINIIVVVSLVTSERIAKVKIFHYVINAL